MMPPCNPTMTTRNKAVFDELAKIAKRLHEISKGALSDMEGADLAEFLEAETLHLYAGEAAESFDDMKFLFDDLKTHPLEPHERVVVRKLQRERKQALAEIALARRAPEANSSP